MTPSALRTALVLAPLLLAACSGKIETTGSGDGGSSSGSSGSSSGGSGSSSGGSGSGSSSGSSSGGGTCVDVVLSSYDTSCQTSSDCISITAGQICAGDCACGGATINASGQARYDAAISSIQLGECACPLEGTPQCLQSQCTICTGGPSDPPECGTSVADAGPPDSGLVCVDIDLSTYDTSCETSSDCVGITSGEICTGSCECGGATINADGLNRYSAAISGIVAGGCPCFEPGTPTCVQKQCILCGLGQPGCPDGG